MGNAYLGQRLRTTTNEFVTVEGIDGDYIFVCYRNKMYKRDKGVIGTKLFVCEAQEEKVHEEPIENEYATIVECCSNCMEMRSGECAGTQGMCDFYRYAPNILSKEKTVDWPKYGDATYYRMKYGKK